jgi:hypothetical protein
MTASANGIGVKVVLCSASRHRAQSPAATRKPRCAAACGDSRDRNRRMH